MSVSTEITRIQTARNTIRTKMVDLGVALSTDNLSDMATKISAITNNGAVAITVQEGQTASIPAGYHNGSGTVTGVGGGGSYTLQAKTATPTKSQQAITNDSGYYGLSSVTIDPIPDAYQDVSSVTASAGDVLSTKLFVDSLGTLTAGTMTNNGAVSHTLDATTGNQSYTVPSGYHSGSGSVGITLETKTATPSGSTQNITPTSGKVLSKVTVNPIPSIYGDATSTDAVAANVLSGKKCISKSGSSAVQITGTMSNNGAVTKTLDATTSNQSYTVPAGYHNGSGTVSITLETKSATPSTSSQDITPTSGKVLSKVTVGAIPSTYGNVVNADAVAANVLYGVKCITKVDGVAAEITGTMTNRGGVTSTVGLATSSYTIPAGYHDGTGTVTLNSDIETALAAI